MLIIGCNIYICIICMSQSFLPKLIDFFSNYEYFWLGRSLVEARNFEFLRMTVF